MHLNQRQIKLLITPHSTSLSLNKSQGFCISKLKSLDSRVPPENQWVWVLGREGVNFVSSKGVKLLVRHRRMDFESSRRVELLAGHHRMDFESSRGVELLIGHHYIGPVLINVSTEKFSNFWLALHLWRERYWLT